ncbi:MAG: hypothetical protein ACRD4I_07040 [Candidatus Angelobacter sp.]
MPAMQTRNPGGGVWTLSDPIRSGGRKVRHFTFQRAAQGLPANPVSNRDFLLYIPSVLHAVLLLLAAVLEAVLLPLIAPLKLLTYRLSNVPWAFQAKRVAPAHQGKGSSEVQVTTARIVAPSKHAAKTLRDQLREEFARGAELDSPVANEAVASARAAIENTSTIIQPSADVASGTIAGEL